jgi:crotonobetainyl-CoA:carnitine CoA-transferase CaiB-like acyl-CoA transferase
MSQVMRGVRVLEVAQFTFVPAAGGILADWGADVIKVEHPVRGDTQRGMLSAGGVKLDPDRHTLIEHPNRGKRSIGIDISSAGGQEVLYALAKTCDVFLTNYLPYQRQKHKFDLEHIRAANPDIIYVRGSALGDKGPERESGGFDSTCFWARSGIAHTMTPPEMDGPLGQGMPAFGDSIGAMFIAGGISAALFHRSQTGEATEVDVSLLSSAWWACGANLAQGMDTGLYARNPIPRYGGVAVNPFIGNFKTSDDRCINLCMISPTGLIRDTFEHVGLPEAADDPRFSDALSLLANAPAASDLLEAAFVQESFAYWLDRLKTMKGQWAPVQSLDDLSRDAQALANDMTFEVEASNGGPPIKLVRGPVQFNGAAVATTRAPLASEHTEMVLLDAGFEWDQIALLKDQGAIA